MTEPAPARFFEGVFDRTLTNLRSAWREIAESARGVLAGAPRAESSADDRRQDEAQDEHGDLRYSAIKCYGDTIIKLASN